MGMEVKSIFDMGKPQNIDLKQENDQIGWVHLEGY
jgi:hypothetical protein